MAHRIATITAIALKATAAAPAVYVLLSVRSPLGRWSPLRDERGVGPGDAALDVGAARHWRLSTNVRLQRVSRNVRLDLCNFVRPRKINFVVVG
mmetsp:Transcript_21828/g.57853  ORF Transcript_21828/g.57853 Transcript_21828/m.57853 type:complete len:94 (+) Transcript_21828:122-403(+)